MYPPLALMRNRRTAETYHLGDDLLIPEGVMIARNAYGVQTDADIWADAATFTPTRWACDTATVKTTFRREQASGRFVRTLVGVLGPPVEDTFLTKPSMGMATTFGPAAPLDAMAAENAAVVDLILDAGMIVLGKTSPLQDNN
ncbi:hypothetical protein NLG97_g2233 [Lecanicillium saksenae]|uniref:Uncharacterized protein n=1 Tax=Lecanicillium saksenae TaxID=468837 RepID=A0ACC1R254_9HYPO|nr:hypothetical protein NLG97_g2233 [Lecanicillium saksenae]